MLSWKRNDEKTEEQVTKEDFVVSTFNASSYEKSRLLNSGNKTAKIRERAATDGLQAGIIKHNYDNSFEPFFTKR